MKARTSKHPEGIEKQRNRLIHAAVFGTAILLTLRPSVVRAVGWESTDFLLVGRASSSPAGIAVLDENLVFKGYLDDSFLNSQDVGFTSSGDAVGIARNPCSFTGTGGEVRRYSPDGSRNGGFLNTELRCHEGLAVGSNDLIYVPMGDNIPGIREFTQSGTFNRTLGGTTKYGPIVALPGGILWVHRFGFTAPPIADVFDTSSGAKISTLTFYDGQQRTIGMSYSRSTGTVLIGDDHEVYERTTSGAFVRKFVYPGLPGWYVPFTGVTRGPNGDVIGASSNSPGLLVRWSADGTYLGDDDLSSSIPGELWQIVWAGEVAPSHLAPVISGPDRISCVLPGTTISLAETATDPEGTFVTLSASGLPTGATFPTVSGTGTATGDLAWTPTGAQVGDFTIPFSATDSGSPPRTTKKNLFISVVATSPISAQPQPQSICAGQTATFSTTAAATASWWQFSSDGINWVYVTGATSSTYTTPPFYWDGYFRCIVTASCGDTPTNAARITITPAPGSPANSLRVNRASTTSNHLLWNVCSGASSYRILRCDSTDGPCVSSLLGTASANSADDTAASAARLWYVIEAANGCGVTP